MELSFIKWLLLDLKQYCNWPCMLAGYAAWFACSMDLKSSTPDCLPAWPVWLIFWPIWKFLDLVGVTQRTEFTEPLNPKKRYVICCSPHGAYAFSGAIWVRCPLGQPY